MTKKEKKALKKLPDLIASFNTIVKAVTEMQKITNYLYEINQHEEDTEHAAKEFNETDLSIIIEGTEFLAAWTGLDHSVMGFTDQECIKAITVHDDIACFHSVDDLKNYLRCENKKQKEPVDENKDN